MGGVYSSFGQHIDHAPFPYVSSVNNRVSKSVAEKKEGLGLNHQWCGGGERG